jgi:CubicO group peptidase (beta-lactamase class C family)
MMTNQLRPDQLAELPELAAFGLGGSGDGLGFGLGGAVVVGASRSGVPTIAGEYSWGGAASTTFWVDRASGLSVVFMTQVLPPSPEMLWDQLHAAIYG